LSLAGTFHRIRSHLLKTGFFMQAMELKIRQAGLYLLLQEAML
jgi:hypothetical protein